MFQAKKSLFICVVLVCCSVSIALAADQIRQKDQKKDGSCQTDLTDGNASAVLAADQTRDRIRTPKRDGSCQTDLTDGNASTVLAADQTRNRIRTPKRDGSCRL